MKLICYPTITPAPELRPAPATRAWQDALPQKYGYRCLPLAIANAHGWELLCPVSFSAWWTGGARLNDVKITCDGPPQHKPVSHFGSGILTLHVGYLIRTEPGFDLYVTGPSNLRKDSIAPLSGVIETDWSSYSFTMNWVFTRPNSAVRFEKGEPFCAFFPVQRGLLNEFEPEIRALGDDPDLKRQFEAWSASRQGFIKMLPVAGSEAHQERWQKSYFQGRQPDGEPGAEDHQTKLRLPEFRDCRPKKD